MLAATLPEARHASAALAILVAMICAGVLGRRLWFGVAILVLLSFAWLTVDAQWEITTLIVIDDTGSRGSGLTLADLVAFAGFGVAAVESFVLLRRNRS